ncbi:MAG: glutamyl-tRNA(Gln) amidotransferase subunit D [Euryarchaeota archaeon RBG_13_57_23]|nr:MAG: glutamyl-tRNA(Gln) amidotransferase subunit D [Euryarchaeota archaeon RBG_13_57_23]
MKYSGFVGEMLERAKAELGDVIEARRGGEVYVGILMPHHDFSSESIITLKLPNGYNIGIRADEKSRIKVVSKREERERKKQVLPYDPAKKDIAVISTGGTIASYVDYRTGAVHPAISAEDLVFSVPELLDLANVRAKVLYSILSENMKVTHWQGLARAVAEELNSGAVGVIVPHGTDTMGFTSAALAFMLRNLTGPVICVGAQRSSDRPSSDAIMNLLAATRLCVESDLGEVVVLMHGESSDSYTLAHRGTKVRKMHSSRRDAFKSVNSEPIAKVEGPQIEFLSEHASRSKGPVELKDKIDGRASMLHFYPGFEADHFDLIANHVKGMVVAGTGLGHVSEEILGSVSRAVDKGVYVYVTTQCLYGAVNLNVYSTGRDMVTAGAVPLGDMLPETAYVKLMWAMGQTNDPEEVRKLMLTNIAGEFTTRRFV